MLADVDNFLKGRLALIKFNAKPLTVYDYDPERDLKETVFPNASVYRIDYEIRNSDIKTDHDYFAVDPVLITAATNTTPIKVTVNHLSGVLDGDRVVRISGVLGNTAANGDWVITGLLGDTFDLYSLADGSKSVGNGAYISGGLVQVGAATLVNRTLVYEYGSPRFVRRPYPTPINMFYEVAVSSTDKSQVNHLNELVHQVLPPGYQSRIDNCLGIASFILSQVFVRDERAKPIYRSVYQYVVDGLWLERLENYIHVPTLEVDYDMIPGEIGRDLI